jgi:VWFA-related protein
VTDKSGNHIHNLKKEDFQVLENGKEQSISAFEEVIASNSHPTPVKVPPGEFTNVLSNTQQPVALTVIAIDTVNTPFLDQAYARQQLLKYLAQNLNSSQPLAMVIIGGKGMKVVQGLTSDPANLVAALKKVGGATPDMQNVDTDTQAAAAAGETIPALSAAVEPNPGLLGPAAVTDAAGALQQFLTQGDLDYAQFKQENAIETTLRAFQGLAWSLSGIAGRKTVIWVTGSFPFYMDSPAALPGGWLSTLYEHAMQALNDAKVSIYPVDARGLVNYLPAADASQRNAPPGPSAVQNVNARAWLHQTTLDTLNEFAEVTGGRAFYNTNDLAGAFKRAEDDASSYYLLGYYLDTKNTKPGWRQLKVKVDHKDVEVRARQGFLVTNTTMNPELTREQDISFAVASPFEATGLPILVQWKGENSAAGKTGNMKEVGFVIHLARNNVTIEGVHNQYNLDFLAVAVAGTKNAATVAQNVKGTLTAENLEKLRASGMGYSNILNLEPGKYEVRFVVRDNLSGHIGSVTAPLTVD